MGKKLGKKLGKTPPHAGSLKEALSKAPIIVCGIISEEFKSMCEKRQICCYDFMLLKEELTHLLPLEEYAKAAYRQTVAETPRPAGKTQNKTDVGKSPI